MDAFEQYLIQERKRMETAIEKRAKSGLSLLNSMNQRAGTLGELLELYRSPSIRADRLAGALEELVVDWHIGFSQVYDRASDYEQFNKAAWRDGCLDAAQAIRKGEGI